MNNVNATTLLDVRNHHRLCNHAAEAGNLEI